MRWIGLPPLALLVVAALFLLMHWMIRPPGGIDDQIRRQLDGIELTKPPPPEEPTPEPTELLADSPPPPPAAPPALGRPDLPALDVPTLAVEPLEVGDIAVPVALGVTGLSLGKTGTFGGFAGTGGSGTGSGSGSGSGGGWVGKPLVPLSTARPQLPEWACEQKIHGWVEAIFTVMPNGKVQNVRIVDADPRGVYEAAAIESIGNWIYAASKRAREVKQKVEMDPAECAYNWQ